MAKQRPGLVGMTAILLQLAVAPAGADDEAMSRKPGLWEVRTSIGAGTAPAQTVTQCIDAATDQMLQSSAGPLDPASCADRHVQRSAHAVTLDSGCIVGGKPASAHTIVTGSLDSFYTMTATARSEALPGGEMAMTMQGKWLGPCAPDQKPGDIILSNGAKINILELQKRAVAPGILPPR